MRTPTLIAGAALSIAGSAGAVDYTTNGNELNLALVADLYDGTLESMASLSICVTESFTITDVDIIVDISHTWAGDLVWKLESPAGTVVDLVSRPGYDEPADDGTGIGGDASDLVFGNVYEIDDSACESSETMGSGGEDPIDSFRLHSSGFMNEFGLTTLNGEDSAGTWTLYVGLSASGDVGTLDGFTLQLPRSLPDPECIRSIRGEATLRAEDGRIDQLPPGVRDGDPFSFFIDYAPIDNPGRGCLDSGLAREWKLSLGVNDFGRCHRDGLGSGGRGSITIRADDPDTQDSLRFTSFGGCPSPNEYIFSLLLRDVDDDVWTCAEGLPSELPFDQFEIVEIDIYRTSHCGQVLVATGESASFDLVRERLEGDADGDCRVTVDDLLDVLAQWGACGVRADFDGDGAVDLSDLLIVLLRWVNWSCTEFRPA